MQGSALPVLQARLLTLTSVSELIQEHMSEMGVIPLLCSSTNFPMCVSASGLRVCEGWRVNEKSEAANSLPVYLYILLKILELLSLPLSWLIRSRNVSAAAILLTQLLSAIFTDNNNS